MLIIKHCSRDANRMENKLLLTSTIGTVLIIIGLIISVIFFNALIETFVWLLTTWLMIIFIVIIFRLKIRNGIKIISIIIFIILINLLFGYVQTNWISSPHNKDPSPIIFRQENNTLIVTEVKGNLTWINFVIIRGNATLPTGLVDPGDIITNCSGTFPYGGILVEWLPSKTMLYWGKYFPSK